MARDFRYPWALHLSTIDNMRMYGKNQDANVQVSLSAAKLSTEIQKHAKDLLIIYVYYQ